jgi:hypothetical protein
MWYFDGVGMDLPSPPIMMNDFMVMAKTRFKWYLICGNKAIALIYFLKALLFIILIRNLPSRKLGMIVKVRNCMPPWTSCIPTFWENWIVSTRVKFMNGP